MIVNWLLVCDTYEINQNSIKWIHVTAAQRSVWEILIFPVKILKHIWVADFHEGWKKKFVYCVCLFPINSSGKSDLTRKQTLITATKI